MKAKILKIKKGIHNISHDFKGKNRLRLDRPNRFENGLYGKIPCFGTTIENPIKLLKKFFPTSERDQKRARRKTRVYDARSIRTLVSPRSRIKIEFYPKQAKTLAKDFPPTSFRMSEDFRLFDTKALTKRFETSTVFQKQNFYFFCVLYFKRHKDRPVCKVACRYGTAKDG